MKEITDPIQIGFQKVTDNGRVTIPRQTCEALELQEGDVVRPTISVAENGMVYLGDTIVKSRYRIRIPDDLRNRFGIEDGDRVQVTLHPTQEVKQ